jgi:hypothetical protein
VVRASRGCETGIGFAGAKLSGGPFLPLALLARSALSSSLPNDGSSKCCQTKTTCCRQVVENRNRQFEFISLRPPVIAKRVISEGGCTRCRSKVCGAASISNHSATFRR